VPPSPRHAPLALLVAFLVVLLSGEAQAESARVERLITSAEDAFLDVEYEDALGSLSNAEGLGEASDEQLQRILALRGTIYVLMEDEGEARASYARLLSMDPGYQLPETHTPRAQAFFDRVRRDIATSQAVSIVHEPHARFAPGEPLVLTATVRGVTAEHTVSIFHRLYGERSYSSTEMTRGDGDVFSGEIPVGGQLDERRGGIVEYFIVVASGEARIANEGSPRNPLSFEVAGSDGTTGNGGGTSVARRWWFWTIIGVAVAAGLGLGLGFGLGGAEDVPTGDVPITLTFADD
jgi:hypothetical protein